MIIIIIILFNKFNNYSKCISNDDMVENINNFIIY